MPSAYDILGVVFGVIGVVSSIPVLLHWVQKRLPLARIAELDRVMAGMKALLDDDARRDEFLDEAERYSFQQRLAGLRQRAWRPRMLAYQATTSAARFRSLFSGLSREIGELHDEALQLRAEISAALYVAASPPTPPQACIVARQEVFVPADLPSPGVSTGSRPLVTASAAPSSRPWAQKPLRSALKRDAQESSHAVVPLRDSNSAARALRRALSLPALNRANPSQPRAAGDLSTVLWSGFESTRLRRRRGKQVRFDQHATIRKYTPARDTLQELLECTTLPSVGRATSE